MKKRLLMVMAAALLVLAGCDQNAEDEASGDGADAGTGGAAGGAFEFAGKTLEHEGTRYVFGADGVGIAYYSETTYNEETSEFEYKNFEKDSEFTYSYDADTKKLSLTDTGFYAGDTLYTNASEYISARYASHEQNGNTYTEDYKNTYIKVVEFQLGRTYVYSCAFSDDGTEVTLTENCDSFLDARKSAFAGNGSIEVKSTDVPDLKIYDTRTYDTTLRIHPGYSYGYLNSYGYIGRDTSDENEGIKWIADFVWKWYNLVLFNPGESGSEFALYTSTQNNTDDEGAEATYDLKVIGYGKISYEMEKDADGNIVLEATFTEADDNIKSFLKSDLEPLLGSSYADYILNKTVTLAWTGADGAAFSVK